MKVPQFYPFMQHSRYDWNFHGDCERACQASPDACYWPRGKMLGGSSGMNLMLYVRGVPPDYDRWAAAGNYGWEWKNVLEYFKKSENNLNFADDTEFHNDDGLLKVSLYGDVRYDELICNAGKEIGISVLKDINGNEHVGNVKVQGTLSDGRRNSAAKAFIAPLKNSNNLDIIKNAFVTKVRINPNGKNVVQFNLNGKNLEATATKEVIICAGSLMSPNILIRSGIGPKEQLKKLKIPSVVNLDVGKNLMDHIAVMLWFSFDPTDGGSIIKLTGDLLSYMLSRTGRFAKIGTFHLLGFLNSRNETKYADLENYHLYIPQNAFDMDVVMTAFNYKPELKKILFDVNRKRDVLCIMVSLLHPESKGTVEASGSSPLNYPTINGNFFGDKSGNDYKTAIRGIRKQMELLTTDEFRKRHAKFIEMPVDYGLFSDTEEYWKSYIKNYAASIYHPVGTCKMGPADDETAVLDPELRVHGVKGLRVADTSM